MISLIKPILAQIENPVLNDPTVGTNPEGYVNGAIQAIISIFLLVAVIYFIWHFVMSAYHMISSNGDPKKWEEAQHSILYAFVGLILVFSVFAILKFVGIVFGIDGLQQLQLTWPKL
jgi:hypothetical protein